jgi:hypothetical protein
MGEKIIFAEGTKIGVLGESTLSYLVSGYIKNYRRNRQAILDKHSWKTSGTGAAFRGDVNTMDTDIDAAVKEASINGTAFIDNEQFVYSVSIDGFSGLFIKNFAECDNESHIVHDNKTAFLSMDYNSELKKLVVSIQGSGMDRNLASVDMRNGHYYLLTEGDSMDENPSWSRCNTQKLYFDTAGIGRDASDMVVALSQRVINSLDFNSGDLEEVISFDKYDCLLPKEDERGELYFIKKPYSLPKTKSTSVLDFLLIPFKLARAIFNWMEFFTMRYTGEAFRSAGNNPTKNRNNPKELFIQGNLVNVEKTLKENTTRGEKYPGIAPRNWELVKRKRDGELVTIKKGVIDYDINAEGAVIYSNGQYLIKLHKDGTEEVLEKVSLASKIKVYSK